MTGKADTGGGFAEDPDFCFLGFAGFADEVRGTACAGSIAASKFPSLKR